MAKTITLTYEGRSYTLEFTRETVKQMERRGFKLTDVVDAPLIYAPELFAGAFKANHPRLDRGFIDEMLDSIPDVRGLVNALCEMYNEPLQTLIDGPSEDDEGKADWATGWSREK